MPEQPPLPTAGFVLTGGASRRMGSDKALLPFGGSTLVEHVADAVRVAAGSVTLVGRPERYAHLCIPLLPDERPDCGPLGGVVTAVASSQSEWSLILACDLPEVTVEFLKELLAQARSTGEVECLVPNSPAAGLQPLCAVWRASALPKLRCALEAGRWKMKEVVRTLDMRVWQVQNPRFFRNVNSPGDWVNGHE